MDPTKSLYLRSLIRKFKCLEQDLSDVKALAEKFDADFQLVWKSIISDVENKKAPQIFKLDLNKPEKAAPEPKSDEPVLKKDPPQTASAECKKVFRKVTLLTHPDRLQVLGLSDEEVKFRHTLFMKAHSAYEANDIRSLIRIALDLEISIEEIGLTHKECIEKIENLMQEEYNKMERITNSIAWLWGTSNCIDQKINLVKTWLAKMGYFNVESHIIDCKIKSHKKGF